MLASLTDTLASNPVLLLFVVAALGFAIGRIRIGGFSLGVAAVLFAGIAVGAIDPRLKLPEPFWVLGLALCVYTVGLASGPGFIAAMRRRGLAANAVVVAAIAASAVVAFAGAFGARRSEGKRHRAPSRAARRTRRPSQRRSRR